MATASQTPTPINSNRRDMHEVKAPEMFKFTRQGQVIAGTLINMEPTTVRTDGRDSQTIEYMLRGENDARLTFLGTNDLNKKIQPNHLGHWLEIRYESDDSSFVKAGQSPAKIFKVLVSKEKEPGF